jgi:hypothetical protein
VTMIRLGIRSALRVRLRSSRGYGSIAGGASVRSKWWIVR